MSRATRVALVILLAVVLLPALASACPLCKDAKSDADYLGGTASLPKGFYYSILLMVSAPFFVVGGLALRIYLARRRFVLPDSAAEATRQPERVRLLVPDPRGPRP
jgi:uncharacterized membrane protein